MPRGLDDGPTLSSAKRNMNPCVAGRGQWGAVQAEQPELTLLMHPMEAEAETAESHERGG